jgi:hypothetical protein
MMILCISVFTFVSYEKVLTPIEFSLTTTCSQVQHSNPRAKLDYKFPLLKHNINYTRFVKPKLSIGSRSFGHFGM